MSKTYPFNLNDVKKVYSGPEKNLWELLMGQQIHVGGLASTMDLVEAAALPEDAHGVDLCCCTGAGMKVLVKMAGMAHMTGVDATPSIINEAKQLAKLENLDGQVAFVLADACKTGLLENAFDFVWGEDAWVYVVDKEALIIEATRLVKPGGKIAFTDWVEGPKPMTKAESQRFFNFMKFPNIQTLSGYSDLLQKYNCQVEVAEYTDNFLPCIELYMAMIGMQHTYDALKIIDFNAQALNAILGEMNFVFELASQNKIMQAMLVAKVS